MVLVCYGTGQGAYSNIHAFAPTDLVISDPKDLSTFGVDEATRFDLARIVELPYTEQWFHVIKKMGPNSAQIGCISKSKLPALQGALKAAGRTDLLPAHMR